jgi:hypothetical protein
MEELQGLSGVEEIYRFDISWRLVSEELQP